MAGEDLVEVRVILVEMKLLLEGPVQKGFMVYSARYFY